MACPTIAEFIELLRREAAETVARERRKRPLPIITAASNKFVRLWSAETGELVQTLENTGGAAEWSTDESCYSPRQNDRTRVFVWEVVGSDLMTRGVRLTLEKPIGHTLLRSR